MVLGSPLLHALSGPARARLGWREAGCEGVQPKCHRPLYERQGSRHKFLAVQPHMSRADAPVAVHGMEL